MDDIIQEFLTETAENLEQLDGDLVALEQDRSNTALLSNIFRTIHTIKGTCGFIGLPRLEKVAHAGENVLGKFRDGDLEVTPKAITAILECVDTIKDIMGKISETGSEPEGDDSILLEMLSIIEKGGKLTDSAPEESIGGDPEDSAPSNPEQESEVLDTSDTSDTSEAFDDFNTFATADTSDALQHTSNTTQEPNSNQAPSISASMPATNPKAPNKPDPILNQTIRVNVGLLENLITSVSELVLARNQLLQTARNFDHGEFKVPLQRMSHVTSELQEGLMRTRMQPVGNAWSNLPRIVRDLSQELGKEIEIDMEGADTELDRQVIEIIKDPLMHMVRNSVDHGLETPCERQEAGKPKKGKIKLCAYHAGGHVVIEISDNGRGLNKEKIKEKLLSKGIVKPEDLQNYSDTQIYNTIFAAGFSTAEKITNVSGRGVGMDVVKSNIERIGGSIEVRSKPGQGSIFTVKIPLTLAIVSALIIRCKTQKFAIPQVSIIELVQASQDNEHTVEFIKEKPVLRLRNKLLPLVLLSTLLKIDDEPATENPLENSQDLDPILQADKPKMNEDQFIIVVQVGSGQFGIIVDEVYDTEEIVVKPVSPILRQTNIFAGNTILGDGSVVMILDPKGITNLMGDIQADDDDTHAITKEFDSAEQRRMRFLLFKAGKAEPKAVPVSMVVRLEEVNMNTIETSNGAPVLQYRNTLMPLLTINGSLDFQDNIVKPILVFEQKGEYLGLVVDELIDIVEENLDLKMNISQQGSYGSMVIAGSTTDLIDIDYFIQQVRPQWDSLVSSPKGKNELFDQPITLCFIDQCTLYRNLIVPLFELQKMHSIVFDDGRTALNYLEESPREIDAMIIDKDSFGISAQEFLEGYKNLRHKPPLYIIGAKFSPEEETFFKNASCVDLLLKQDRDTVLATIGDYIKHSRGFAA